MSPSKRSARTSLGAKLALIFIPSLLLIAGIEGATRLYIWMTLPDGLQNSWVFEYEPYLVVKRKGRMQREFPEAESQYRVLLLGGSTAAQMPDDVLASAFAAHTDRDVVIMNLAEGGYILNQERVMLALRGIELAPDLLLTLDGANDFVMVSKLYAPGETVYAQYVALGVERPFLNAVLGVVRRSHFVSALNKLRERRAERSFQAETLLREQTVDHLIGGWKSIAVVAHGLEVPYLMVLQPYLHLRETITKREKGLAGRYDYRKAYSREMFGATAERMARAEFAGETYPINGTRFFDEVHGVEIFRDGVHMTPEGNQLLAQAIVEAALARGVEIPPRGN